MLYGRGYLLASVLQRERAANHDGQQDDKEQATIHHRANSRNVPDVASDQRVGAKRREQNECPDLKDLHRPAARLLTQDKHGRNGSSRPQAYAGGNESGEQSEGDKRGKAE